MRKAKWKSLCGIFETCMAALSEQFGITLDYSKQSITPLQAWIGEYQPLPARAYPGCVIAFGWYLGECVVRNIPGAHWDWKSAVNDHYDWEVALDNMSLRPLVRMRKFYEDREYNLDSWWIAAEVGSRGVDAATFARDVEQALIEAGHDNVQVATGVCEHGRYVTDPNVTDPNQNAQTDAARVLTRLVSEPSDTE